MLFYFIGIVFEGVWGNNSLIGKLIKIDGEIIECSIENNIIV